MIDAVLSYHLNPLACGVAKFNQQLARHLGVPCVHYTKIHDFTHPLLSVKPSEMTVDHFPGSGISINQQYDLLLHGRPYLSYPWQQWLHYAARVFDAETLGCPSTVDGNPTRGAYKVLTFGMAHKLVLSHFERLRQQLEDVDRDYTISLSCAVHEGSPWDTALHESADGLRAIFGDRLRVLGFLMDDALAKELQECDAVAMFFSPALRRNNTSYWAAVQAGKRVYTNRDDQSPQDGDPPPTWAGLAEVFRA